MKLSEIKEAFAERFFERELDDAYLLGIKEGTRNALSSARVKIEMRKGNYTPARQEGMQVALDVIDVMQDGWKTKNG